MQQEPKKEKQRTITQNRALHLWFELVATTLNDAGLDMRKTLKPSIDIPWTKMTVKDFLWRPIQKAMLQKDSTKKLTTKEIDTVYDVINKHLSEKLGVHQPFPSIDEIMANQEWENYFNKEKHDQ